MIDAALVNDLTEMLSQSLNQEQIDAFGRLLIKDFNSHSALGLDRHVTVPKRSAAATIIEMCEAKQRMDDLLQLLVETDGRPVNGKIVTFSDLDTFLNRLARTGIIYDFQKRKLKRTDRDVSELRNWGSLRDGHLYPVSIASLDIVGNSRMVREYGAKKVERLYHSLWELIRFELSRYDGRIWSWAGDGGVLAFALKSSETRAVKWALSVQRLLPVFNADSENPTGENVQLRIGISSGELEFHSDTGTIVAEVINYAAHLEKQKTPPGSVSISHSVHAGLSPRLAGLFEPQGEFEGAPCYSSVPEVSAETVAVE